MSDGDCSVGLGGRAVNLIEEHVAVAAVLAHRAGRTAQVQARGRVLGGLVKDLARDGVDHLIIESRRPRDDGRDRSVLLDTRRTSAATFTYDWRTKAEPLLWYADALAGVAREQLTFGVSEDFRFLQDARILNDIRYVV